MEISKSRARALNGFGRAAIMELRTFYPDVWANDETTVLLDALFPKRCSCVYAVG